MLNTKKLIIFYMIIFISRSTLQLTWKVSKKAALRLDGKRVKVLIYD